MRNKLPASNNVKTETARAASIPASEDTCNDREREIARLELAWAKAAVFFRTGFRAGHPRGSIRTMSLVEVHRQLSVYRARFERGNTLSLLQAINLCAEENLPLPEWLALGFQQQMSVFLHPGKVHSLDQVFRSVNVPTGTPKKAATARQDWKLAGELYVAIWDVVRNDETVNSLDRAVERLLAGAQFGVRKTKAKALIMMLDTSQSEFLGGDRSLSRFLEKRRKLRT